jgi:hypothetical protein
MEVMRVIKNFDTLLDIPTVILNKAKTYIAQKYDKKTADAFMELIQNEYDITVGKGGLQPDNEYEVMSHTAVGARTPSA